MHSHRQTLSIMAVKILTAGALNLYHTVFWNFKEKVCLTALPHIEKLAMYGMSYLAFLTMTASSHTAQCVSSLREQRKLKYEIHNTKHNSRQKKNPTPLNFILHSLHQDVLPTNSYVSRLSSAPITSTLKMVTVYSS